MTDTSNLETKTKTHVHATGIKRALKQNDWHLDYARPGEGDPCSPEGPVNWHDMEDDQYQETWGALSDFLAWALPHWGFTTEQIPHQCWWLHFDVIEELTAWWGLWQACVRNPKAPISSQIDFQEHTHLLKQRLDLTYRGRCRHEHQSVQALQIEVREN